LEIFTDTLARLQGIDRRTARFCCGKDLRAYRDFVFEAGSPEDLFISDLYFFSDIFESRRNDGQFFTRLFDEDFLCSGAKLCGYDFESFTRLFDEYFLFVCFKFCGDECLGITFTRLGIWYDTRLDSIGRQRT